MKWAMMKHTVVFLAAAASVLAAASVVRADLVIDEFSEKTSPSWPGSLTAGGAIGITDSGLATVPGGTRTTFLTYVTGEVPGLDEVQANLFNTGGFSLLDYGSTTGAEGGLSVRYSGAVQGGLVLDLSGSGFIRVDLVGYDAPSSGPMSVSVLLISDWGGANQQSVNLPTQVTTAGAQPVFVGLHSVPSSVDFTNINYVEVSFYDAPKGADFRVDRIVATAVPEPATLGLLGAGLGVLAARRRRK